MPLEVCEVCGAPATHPVCDVQETEPKDGFRTFRVHSEHFFCNQHKRKSLTYPPEESVQA